MSNIRLANVSKVFDSAVETNVNRQQKSTEMKAKNNRFESWFLVIINENDKRNGSTYTNRYW